SHNQVSLTRPPSRMPLKRTTFPCAASYAIAPELRGGGATGGAARAHSTPFHVQVSSKEYPVSLLPPKRTTCLRAASYAIALLPRGRRSGTWSHTATSGAPHASSARARRAREARSTAAMYAKRLPRRVITP